MLTRAQITTTTIKAITHAYPNVLAIYIFGSFATGKVTPTSDVDIAILLPHQTDKYNLWKTAQELAILIDRDIDLIDLRAASTILSFQIISTSKRIFCQDIDKVATFENVALSEYISFQERLAPLFSDIKHRGWVTHGQYNSQ